MNKKVIIIFLKKIIDSKTSHYSNQVIFILYIIIAKNDFKFILYYFKINNNIIIKYAIQIIKKC